MASSTDVNASAPETLNPPHQNPAQPSIHSPTDGHEPSDQSPQEGKEQNDQRQTNLPSTDGTDVGEKRKRDDPKEAKKSDSNGSVHPLWKTSLCSYFRRHAKSCSHGDGCRYAHGEEELRPRPDNTWDPTSERAKKMMKFEVPSSTEDDVLMTDVLFHDCSDASLCKCLKHLPIKWSSDDLRSFLDEQGILFKLAKKKEGMTAGFVSFDNAEQVKSATEELDGRSVGNKSLKFVDVIPRSFETKVKLAMTSQSTQQVAEPTLASDKSGVCITSNELQDGDTVDDGLTPDGLVSKAKSARDVVTPLAHMPYVDQLEHKKNSLMQTLKRLTRNARKACPNGVSLPEWILKSREIGGLPCKFEGVLESPLVNGYRNKCEFSVGYSLQGKPTVGFMLGNFREGVTAVQEPVDCLNVSRIACKYASVLQDFLRNSNLPIWNRFNNTGFWRQLTVREGRGLGKVAEIEDFEANISEVMLIIQVCSKGFDDALITSELEKMAQAFAAGSSANSPSLPLTTLVVQDHTGISNVAPADAPLRSLTIPKTAIDSGCVVANDVAEARIHDYISNLRFCISPTAFFQVNSLAAEKLYSLAGDWANLNPDTLLFDICCGTGTIGLTLAHHVGMVVGIEMNASAVSDAHRNAEINGIKNCRFVCAKAEDVMGSLLKEYLQMPHKQDEIPGTKEKDAPTENIPDPEGSQFHVLENGGVSGCSENNGQELTNQHENRFISEDGNASLQQFKNVVVIVDPPRAGLHPTVIKALRTHAHLRRLVYISCNPESLVANAIELCTPSTDKTEGGNKNNRGWRNMSSAGLARHRAKSMPNSEPFRPVKAMAVDLFPHTPHCEMVMLLER
ncbi:zinc finger CCCH domain-containing protein 24 [Malania oleifera]|uniref:zinc finger CCCH domain-containing protein 24 n=1 Tax=Malania oleifera TaxID=397392 RepID=UPI0025AEC133|nr:zinc finger CCCH domain-containing protein 24 [Malania oleifera]